MTSFPGRVSRILWAMNALPQKQRNPRAARIRPAEYTPAVLRIEDGSCTQATLEMYSLTGGLLSLQKPLDKGSRARVLFLTQTGPVLGMAEMLRPLSWTEQPFRFLTMHEEDQRKLRAATQSVAEIAVECAAPAAISEAPVSEITISEGPISEMTISGVTISGVTTSEVIDEPAAAESTAPALDLVKEEPWIQKYRTAIYDSPPPEKRFSGKLVAVLAAAGAGLGAVVYAFQHLLR